MHERSFGAVRAQLFRLRALCTNQTPNYLFRIQIQTQTRYPILSASQNRMSPVRTWCRRSIQLFNIRFPLICEDPALPDTYEKNWNKRLAR